MPEDTYISDADGHLSPTAISAWLDGELAPSHEEALRSHLATCPACSEATDQLRAVADTLGTTVTTGTDGPPSAATDRRAMAAAHALAAFDEASEVVAGERRAIQTAGERRRRAGRWRTAVASVAAVVALGGAVTGGAVLLHGSSSATSSAARALGQGHQPFGAGAKSPAAATTGSTHGAAGASGLTGSSGPIGVVVRPPVPRSLAPCSASSPPTASGTRGGVVQVGPAATTCLDTKSSVLTFSRSAVVGISRRGGPAASGKRVVTVVLRQPVSLARHRLEAVVGAVAVGTIEGGGTPSTRLEVAGVTPPGYRLLLRAIGR